MDPYDKLALMSFGVLLLMWLAVLAYHASLHQTRRPDK